MNDVHGGLAFAYERYTITVTDVPMTQCEKCDERLVAGPIGIAVSVLVSDVHESLQRREKHSEDHASPTDAIVIHYSAKASSESFALA